MKISFLHNKQKEVAIFLVAFFIRMATFIVLFSLSSYLQYSYPVIGVDSSGYVSIADNLIAEGRFANLGSEEFQSYAMPGYPFYLAVIMLFSGGIWLASIIQIILSSLSAVIIYRIGLKISGRVGIIAAVLFIFDPIGIFFSGTILTETLFIFLVLLSVYIFLQTGENIYKKILLAGLILGVATLTRPSGIILPFSFIPIIFLFPRPIFTKRKIIAALIFVVSFTFVVFPWSVRNKILFNTYELTAVATTQWYQYSAPLYYAHKNNVTPREANEVFKKRLLEINPYGNEDGTLRNTPYMRKVVLEYLSKDPYGYIKYHIIKTAPFFVSDGLRDIARRINIISTSQPNVGDMYINRNYGGLIKIFIFSGASSVLLVIGSGFWFLVNILIVGGILFLRKTTAETKKVVLLSVLTIVLAAAIAGGPNANARYRLSISPFMFIVASYGYYSLLSYARRKLKYRPN